MADVSDMELLRDYDRQGSEEAFAGLVRRHLNLVYSVALRHTGNAAHAEEITQAVFIILARKGASLRPDTVLEGWLHQTARLTALRFMRGERRRQFREQEAYMQSDLQESPDASIWNQLAPLLDEALSSLGNKDRDAVMLRFFKEKSLREVAVALSVNEAVAQKRVHRAVEKLRRFFTKRGVVLTAAVLTGAISANSIQAAPVSLAKSITAIALTKGAAAGSSTLTLIKGALKIMAWTKAKTAIVVGVAVILAAGTATITIKTIPRTGAAARLAQEGWQLLQTGKRSEATAKFNQAIKSDPKTAEAWNGLGWTYLNSGNPQEAEPMFQKVLLLNPDHPGALNGLGRFYLSQKNYDEAEKYLLRASPNAPAAWFGLAQLYLLQEKYAQAEEWARKAVDSSQGNDFAKMMLQAAQDKQVSPKLRTMIKPR